MVPGTFGRKRPSPFRHLLTSITRPLQWATDMPPPDAPQSIQIFIMFPDGAAYFCDTALTVQAWKMEMRSISVFPSRRATGCSSSTTSGSAYYRRDNGILGRFHRQSTLRLQACSIRAFSKSCFICSLMAYTHRA